MRSIKGALERYSGPFFPVLIERIEFWCENSSLSEACALLRSLKHCGSYARRAMVLCFSKDLKVNSLILAGFVRITYNKMMFMDREWWLLNCKTWFSPQMHLRVLWEIQLLLWWCPASHSECVNPTLPSGCSILVSWSPQDVSVDLLDSI